jgi:histidine kinase
VSPSIPPPGVQLVTTGDVFRSAHTQVVAGRTSAGQAVIVKTPTAQIPDASELARYRRERAFLDAVAGPGIPEVVDLIERDGTVSLVMKFRGGRSLAEWLSERRISVDEGLGILEEAASILARVHAAGVIHKDVAPANLVWGGEPGSLQLVDFGISAREGEAGPAGRLEGTLRYLAPEATGRFGHPITWRSDLYALGATAWHLLTGRPPFEDSDPLALVHAHLARAPEPPHLVAPAVPPCLSAVVMRLMTKDPERRYQSAEGLLADLRRCRGAIACGEPAAFALASDDAPPHFAPPEHLYGRQAEVAALLAALGAGAEGGVSFALVEGPSGIGKSALVARLAEPARGAGARMVRGRFEQLGRDTPLKAVSEACEALVAGLLAADRGTLSRTREQLQLSLGSSAGLLLQTIPSLRLLLGALPPTPAQSDQAAAVNAMQAHATLFGALVSSSSPVVLFLDDLQWADAASLDLVNFLVGSPDIRGLLIIGGCRMDGAGSAHALTRMCERLETTGRPFTRIRPGPLDLASTTALVADACRCTPEAAAPLAEALRERTDGNPFFLRTLLLQMHERGLLQRRGTGWSWSADAPARLGFADNVVDAVLERLGLLPEETARALGVAARMGHRFDVWLLAQALERPAADVAASLAPGVEAGLVRPESDAWGLLMWGAGERVEAGCRFVHDRVQEAALRLLPAAEAPGVHLRLARLLSRESNATGQALFDALEHYRAALTLVDEQERIPIARLALDACTAAVRSAAFDAALRACELGLLALGRRDQALWELLCTRAIGVAEAAANNEALERHASALIAGASSLAATAPAYVARIHVLTRTDRFPEAIDTANLFLNKVGTRIETRMRPAPLLGKLAHVLWSMGTSSPEEVVGRPESNDPLHAAIASVRIATSTALASAHPHAVPLDILTDMDDVLTHGVTPDGLFAWTGWSILLTEGLRRPELAIRYCKLALDRAERMGAPASWAAIALVHDSLLFQWKAPLSAVADALFRTRDRALELGELSPALSSGFLADQIMFFEGRPLPEVTLAHQHSLALVGRYRSNRDPAALASFGHLLAALQGHSPPDAPHTATGPEGSFGEQSRANTELMRAIFFGDRREAWRVARDTPAVLSSPLRSPIHFVWWTYRSVALLRAAAVGLLSPREARQIIEPGRRLLERWSTAIPARRYRLLWLDAADAALRGAHATALASYERAIDLARSHGARHDAALMAEHAAEVALANGQPRLRGVLLEEASAGYRQWGAHGKVEQLAAALPLRPTTTSTGTQSGDLDLETLFRASLALSGEIRLDRLVGQVVAVTIQNAGATRGFLVTERGGELCLEVGRSASGEELVAPGTRVSAFHQLAASVVHYVAHTGEQLVLANGVDDRRFASDPYLQGGAIASILCTPLVHKGNRTGIIYLENHLVPGCFTPARLKTVQVLASQAAVAIQNASLVDNLEAKVEERTHALQGALEQTRVQHQQLMESQHALAQSERLALLGQLVAGVAHELNTPLGAIGAIADNLAASAQSTLLTLSEVLAEAGPDEREGLSSLVRRADDTAVLMSSREQRAARRELSPRLAELGVDDAPWSAECLVSLGITQVFPDHIVVLRSPLREKLLRAALDITTLRRSAGSIQEAVSRSSRIVFALKSYAQPGGHDGWVEGSIPTQLNTVLTLYGHQIKLGFEVVRNFVDDPVVEAMHSRLNQVWTNLIHNALQAMGTSGTLTISVALTDADHVAVSVVDTGPGIPQAVLDRVFDPFFTTKAAGEGTGLGLSISKEIVDAHAGTLTVDSAPGRTAFVVTLPIRSDQLRKTTSVRPGPLRHGPPRRPPLTSTAAPTRSPAGAPRPTRASG